jgi:hypothetical protein
MMDLADVNDDDDYHIPGYMRPQATSVYEAERQ